MPTLNSQLHIDRALTNISVAYIQDPNIFVADKVFPVVPVQKQSDRYFIYNKGDFFRDGAQFRAPGTESAGGDYDVDNTPSYYANKIAFHKDISAEERTNADDPLKPDIDATTFITQKMLIRREIDFMAKYFKTGVWSTDIVGAASAPTAGQVLQWNVATSNPIVDVQNGKLAVQAVTGFKPNTLVLGPAVYAQLRNHPLIIDRIKYTQRGILTIDLLAALLDVEKVMIAEAVLNSASKGATDSINFMAGKHAMLTYSAPNPGLMQPTAGYTFAWTGLEGAGAFGNVMGRIQMPWLGKGTERIEGEMAYDLKVVAPELGYFFSGVVA